MRIRAGEIDPKDFGSRIIMREENGTIHSRILTGVSHVLRSPQLIKHRGVIKAEYSVTRFFFSDRSEVVVPAERMVELDPEEDIKIEVRNLYQAGLE